MYRPKVKKHSHYFQCRKRIQQYHMTLSGWMEEKVLHTSRQIFHCLCFFIKKSPLALSLLSFFLSSSSRLSSFGWVAEILFTVHVPACQLPGAQCWLGVLLERSQPGIHEELQPDVTNGALLYLPDQEFACTECKLWASVFGTACPFRSASKSRDFPHVFSFYVQLEGADLYHQHQDSLG